MKRVVEVNGERLRHDVDTGYTGKETNRLLLYKLERRNTDKYYIYYLITIIIRVSDSS